MKRSPSARAPSPTWRAFLNNHVKVLVSIDFFTVPTVTFRILFVFVALSRLDELPSCPFGRWVLRHG